MFFRQSHVGKALGIEQGVTLRGHMGLESELSRVTVLLREKVQHCPEEMVMIQIYTMSRTQFKIVEHMESQENVKVLQLIKGIYEKPGAHSVPDEERRNAFP